jgi:hypothetical protein
LQIRFIKLREQGVEFVIVLVLDSVVNFAPDANKAVGGFQAIFRLPVILCGDRSGKYYGRRDVVDFLAHRLHPGRIRWGTFGHFHAVAALHILGQIVDVVFRIAISESLFSSSARRNAFESRPVAEKPSSFCSSRKNSLTSEWTGLSTYLARKVLNRALASIYFPRQCFDIPMGTTLPFRQSGHNQSDIG